MTTTTMAPDIDCRRIIQEDPRLLDPTSEDWDGADVLSGLSDASDLLARETIELRDTMDAIVAASQRAQILNKDTGILFERTYRDMRDVTTEDLALPAAHADFCAALESWRNARDRAARRMAEAAEILGALERTSSVSDYYQKRSDILAGMLQEIHTMALDGTRQSDADAPRQALNKILIIAGNYDLPF